MKKLLVVTVVLALLVSCGGGGGGGGGRDGGDPNVPTATFWAQNVSTQAFYSFQAEMLASNNLCEVWVQKGSGVSKATANVIASEYSSNIYPKMKDAFSVPITLTDVGKSFPSTIEMAHWIVEELTGKKNSKLTILLLDIKDDYQKGVNEAYVAGYFAMRDFYPEAEAIKQSVHSNERTIISMDINPGLNDLDDLDEFYSTIAHELQHLMNFATNLITKENLVDVWVNEGLSAAAEWVYTGQYSEIRIDTFNKDPSTLIKKGNNFFVWGNRDEENQYANLDDYATVYLFFQWLRLKGSGTDVYKKIIFSEEADYGAVVEAMKGTSYSTWPKLLEGWMKASFYRSNSDGYDNVLNNKLQFNIYAPGGSNSLDLWPGEGVYSYVDTSRSVTSSSGNINYLGLNIGGSTTATIDVGGALLTYNNSTSNGFDDVPLKKDPGTITGTAAPNIVTSGRFSTPDILRRPYAISMGDMIRRRGGNERNFDLTVIDSTKLFKGVLIE